MDENEKNGLIHFVQTKERELNARIHLLSFPGKTSKYSMLCMTNPGVHCTVYTVQCLVFNVRCSMYDACIKYTMMNNDRKWIKFSIGIFGKCFVFCFWRTQTWIFRPTESLISTEGNQLTTATVSNFQEKQKPTHFTIINRKPNTEYRTPQSLYRCMYIFVWRSGGHIFLSREKNFAMAKILN